MKNLRRHSISFLCALILLSLVAPTALTITRQGNKVSTVENNLMQLPPGQDNMTFTSDITLNLTSGNYIDFTSGNQMTFTTGITFQFVPSGGPTIEYCFWGQIINPIQPPPQLAQCTWWEIKDPNGEPTGFEFHVDAVQGSLFHVDSVYPGPFPWPAWPFAIAELKIDTIQPCDYFVVQEPPEWGPPNCTWWEILYPPQWEGVEFHVDWSNESCEFHVDQVIGVAPILDPWPYHVVAEEKIQGIKPCDYFVVKDPATVPEPCSWWEVVYPKQYFGYEFHVDWQDTNGTFHVDAVTPGNLTMLMPTPDVIAEKKITTIKSCVSLNYQSPSGYAPQACDWWEIIYPPQLKGYEFHIDSADQSTVHVDTVIPTEISGINSYEVVAEKKISTMQACDSFKIVDPPSWHPDIDSWWKIVAPPEWNGVRFHIDTYSGVNQVFTFHIDSIDALPPLAGLPVWNVTAEPIPNPWYFKPSFNDYALSGMPDFDERQGGTYNWIDQFGKWSHCAPVAIANSLWWLDSEFEPNTVLPPAISDNFSLVTAYGQWDDHDSKNVAPLVEHLAFLMDCDGRRTGLAHSGTNVIDSQTGITHYLSWSGVNPIGDVNGDGIVNGTDLNIVNAAMGSMPGAPNWNMAADIYPVTTVYPPSTNNVVNASDLALVQAHMNQTGMFYEHTVNQPTFEYIEAEVEKCQDVVLCIGYWIWTGSSWYREDGHFVTVAGVDSTDSKIAISDPIRDAFENGLILEGRIPIPHVHMPPEPPYITHNDAAYVSQDIYTVAPLPPFPLPCPGGNLTLLNFPVQGVFVVIEYAVVTSPSAVRDVAVRNIWTSKDGCSPMPTVPENSHCEVNVTVMNKGAMTETFDVILYANTTVIGTKTVTGLLPGNQVQLNFTWNTGGWARGAHLISAYAVPVPGDANTTDNTYTHIFIRMTKIGNINGDGSIDIFDAILLSGAYGSNRGESNWNPNSDLNDDNTVDIFDAIMLSNHYGEDE